MATFSIFFEQTNVVIMHFTLIEAAVKAKGNRCIDSLKFKTVLTARVFLLVLSRSTGLRVKDDIQVCWMISKLLSLYSFNAYSMGKYLNQVKLILILLYCIMKMNLFLKA